MITVYLTQRNLKTLLSKLDRVANGQVSSCTLIKKDTDHKKYPQTDWFPYIYVSAEEDKIENIREESSYAYVSINRNHINTLLSELNENVTYELVIGSKLTFAKVIGIQDTEYYTDRTPGSVLPFDDPNNTKIS